MRPVAPQPRGQTPQVSILYFFLLFYLILSKINHELLIFQDFINLEDDYDGDGDVEFDEFVEGAYQNPALAVPLAFT